MTFKTHLGRGLDFSRRSNQLIVGLTAATAVASAVVVLSGGAARTWLAPIYLFIMWALVRELDPDHETPAILTGVATAVWVLAGLDTEAWFGAGALVIAARLVSNSTGRRPLKIDLVAVGIGAAAISFTIPGWIGGVGIALAIYLNDRMDSEQDPINSIAAALTALGASLVAATTGAFTEANVEFEPQILIAAGILALIAVVRKPEPPRSLVDARRKTPLEPRRLHVARVLIALLVLLGADAAQLAPLVFGLAVVLMSNELERLRRRAN